jgi:hypothetical protein
VEPCGTMSRCDRVVTSRSWLSKILQAFSAVPFRRQCMEDLSDLYHTMAVVARHGSRRGNRVLWMLSIAPSRAPESPRAGRGHSGTSIAHVMQMTVFKNPSAQVCARCRKGDKPRTAPMQTVSNIYINGTVLARAFATIFH